MSAASLRALASPASASSSRTYARVHIISGSQHARHIASTSALADKSGSSRSPARKSPVVKKEKGPKVHPKLQTRQPAFKALPPAQLPQEIFNLHPRQAVDVPAFNPKLRKVAEAMRMPLNEHDPAHAFGLPKSLLLEYRKMSTPYTVVRNVTKDVVQLVDDAAEKPSTDTRVVFTGASGSGKSTLLLQALNYCAKQGWIVLYIPRAISLVNSTYAYAYDLRTQTYAQPTLSYQLLQRMLAINHSHLSALELSQDVMLPRGVKVAKGEKLTKLVRTALEDVGSAQAALSALMDQLASQTKTPVLIAVDDFQALYCKTTYRDPNFSTIKPYHLSVPRLLLEYAGGRKSFARGAVLAALSTQNTVFDTPLELVDALGLHALRPSGPYVPRSAELAGYAAGLRAVDVPTLSVEEAATVFELWSKDGALSTSASDETFMAKYHESAGNAREFVQRGLLSSLEF